MLAGYFCFMTYLRDNYNKKAQYIREVYLSVKEKDIPDTKIILSIFPKFKIYINYCNG